MGSRSVAPHRPTPVLNSLNSAHAYCAIKYIILFSCRSPFYWEGGAMVPLRDLWSSLVRSGPPPQNRSSKEPRERPGTGSGHCMSSLDTRSKRKSVSDEGLEGNRGVESGAGYTQGFSYFGGTACKHSNKPPNLRVFNQTHFLSHREPGKRTLMANSVCCIRKFSVLPMPELLYQ